MMKVNQRHRIKLWIQWIAANALIAWAFGMPIVFLVAGTAPEGAAFQAIVWMLLTIAAAGGIVGAIHGLVLVWLLRPKRPLAGIA